MYIQKSLQFCTCMCSFTNTLHFFLKTRLKLGKTRLAVGMDKPWTGDGFGDIMQKKPIWGF